MVEKVIQEFRIIETEDGFRIEIKGDKERIRQFVMGLDPRNWERWARRWRRRASGAGFAFGPWGWGFGPWGPPWWEEGEPEEEDEV
jgi:hypothetical protein